MSPAFRALVLLLALFAATPALAGRDEPLRDHQRTDFPVLPGKPVTVERAHDAIANAGSPRGWLVMKDQPGLLTMRNVVRGKHVVVIDVHYDATGMVIDYVSSENLNYRLKSGGRAEIHPKYHQWTNVFAQDVLAALAR